MVSGFDKIRSRITIDLTDGRRIEGSADERYRGGPEHPLTDTELEGKVRACSEGVLDDAEQDKLIQTVWRIQNLDDARMLADVIQAKVDFGAG